ncbi:hypothetical protein [Salinibaculum rarum]|uniref:hypothetical protein n=1 Tax=Salinibaculum rarum TaxID=3058903 RepID=UPI00265F970D|nr:hypothetical protein [Salinibaculum sp. KK48]
MTDTPSPWTKLDDEDVSGQEYQNVEVGWRNAETSAEVIVYRVTGTGMEEVTDKQIGVQHPYSKDDEDNVEFFDDLDAATNFATDYITNHPAPANTY